MIFLAFLLFWVVAACTGALFLIGGLNADGVKVKRGGTRVEVVELEGIVA